MPIILFDIDKNAIDYYNKVFSDNDELTCVYSDVAQLIKDYKVDAVVSPANCMGFMDGGIDAAYSKMFPGIQKKVQKQIATYKIESNIGRKMLPIGSAIMVDTDDEECPYLISSPTMFFPESIVGTENAYYAFLSVLQLHKHRPSMTIACPGLGTGIGKLTAEDFASQVKRAYHDFNTRNVKYTVKRMIDITTAFVLEWMACEQPNTYANRELNEANFIKKNFNM
jgi:O-acetyl-ADP-ribose deacetylase (regulator of RNase III)